MVKFMMKDKEDPNPITNIFNEGLEIRFINVRMNRKGEVTILLMS